MALQVNGGTDAVRYFVSGNIDNETGPIQMPGFEVQRFDSLHVRCATNGSTRWRSRSPFRDEPVGHAEPEVRPHGQRRLRRRSDNRIEPESDLIIALYYTGMQNYGFKGPGLDKVDEPTPTAPVSTTICSGRRATSCST